MKLVIGAVMAAMFAASAPAWADGGHGHWRGYGNYKQWKQDRHWHKYRAHRERYIVREYVREVPVYPAYPAPAPGVHVIFPDVYIPFPR
ncbi:MAG: hypothetical protein HY526_03285 [Betaproteobacteria bacterium]|nr:hypothetical protein [Betaproteobacteria bacterium]